MKLPSVMSHNFGTVSGPQLSRSKFNRSHGYKTAFNAGDLIPFYVDEVLPGDTINLRAQMFARMSPIVRPVMDNLFLDTFFFFVPTRLLWDSWEKFNGSQENPDDPIDYEVPELVGDPLEFDQGTIFDYMGLPTKVQFDSQERISCLPLRAYNFIWNEWFRDQNMQDSVPFYTVDAGDAASTYSILKRGKRHDYFTSCLPFAQKGDNVYLPIGISAPVVGDGNQMGLMGFNGGATTISGVIQSDDAAINGDLALSSNLGVNGATAARSGGVGDFRLGLSTNPATSHVYADLTGATAATVGELREAVAFQHVLERDARGGTRYTEMLQAHWGVSPRDERLQRPEYLGGGSQRINISAVAQTAPSPASPTSRDVQGGLAAYGTAIARDGFMKSFPEYGYVIGLVNVRADLTYQQGLRRMWSRSTRFDFALPDLMHLGEQPVYQKEIYYADLGATANTIFGYQERYAEYRYHPSMVTGPFRSNYTGTLDSWHLALNFASAPTLDTAFIQDAPPMDRVLSVTTEPDILFDSYISIEHARCMPVYSVPGLERL